MQKLTIDGDGVMRFIWSDDMVSLRSLGACSITRASHVEPTVDGDWTADMGPVGGPVLGPYATRGDALAAEVAWLQSNRGL